MDEVSYLLASLTTHETLVSIALHVVVITLVPVVLLLIFTSTRVSTQLALYFADSWSLRRLPRYRDPLAAWKMMWNTINWTNFCEKMRRKDGSFHPMLNCGPSAEGRHWVAISDPELVKSILMCPEPDEETVSLYAKLKVASPTFADAYTAWIGESLLSSQGSKWHIHRKAATPLFFFTVLHDQLPFISRSTYDLVRSIRTQDWPHGFISPTNRVSSHVMRCLLHLIAGPDVVQEASTTIARHSIDWMIEQQHSLVQHFRSSLNKTSFIGGRLWHILGGRLSSMLPWLGGEGNLHALQKQRYNLACYCQSLINRLRYEEEDDADAGPTRSNDLLSMLFYMKLDEDFAIHQQMLAKSQSRSSATTPTSLTSAPHTPTPPLPSRRNLLKRSQSGLRRSSASLVVTPPLSPSDGDSSLKSSGSTTSMADRLSYQADLPPDATPPVPAKFTHEHAAAAQQKAAPKFQPRKSNAPLATESPDYSPILAPAPYQSDSHPSITSKLRNFRISMKSSTSIVGTSGSLSPTKIASPKSARSPSSTSTSFSTATTATNASTNSVSTNMILDSGKQSLSSKKSPLRNSSPTPKPPATPPLSFLDSHTNASKSKFGSGESISYEEEDEYDGTGTTEGSDFEQSYGEEDSASTSQETTPSSRNKKKNTKERTLDESGAEDGEEDEEDEEYSGDSGSSRSGESGEYSEEEEEEEEEHEDRGWETSSDGSAREEDEGTYSGPNPALTSENWNTMPYKDGNSESEEEKEEDDPNNVPGSQPHRPGHLHDETIIDHALAFLSAGFQTTSSTIEWCLYHLAKDADLTRSLQEEVHTVLDGLIPNTVIKTGPSSPRCEEYVSVPKRMMGEIGRAGSGLGLGDIPITATHYSRLKKTHNFVKEVLRFHPTQPVVERITTDKVKLGGHSIPEGTAVGLMVWNLHRDPKLWQEPERFWPERFEYVDEEHKVTAGGPKHTHAFLPFAAGHHSCIAQKYAMYLLVTTVALIVRAFDLELDYDAQVKETFFDGVLSPQNLNIRFMPRDIAPSLAPLRTTVQALQRTISRGSQLAIKTNKTEESSSTARTSKAAPTSSPTVSRRSKAPPVPM